MGSNDARFLCLFRYLEETREKSLNAISCRVEPNVRVEITDTDLAVTSSLIGGMFVTT